MRLNDIHKKAIILLVSGVQKKEVAEKVGFTPGTISNWLKEEEFQAELSFLRNYIYETSQLELKEMLAIGVQNMRELLTSKNETTKRKSTELLFKVLGIEHFNVEDLEARVDPAVKNLTRFERVLYHLEIAEHKLGIRKGDKPKMIDYIGVEAEVRKAKKSLGIRGNMRPRNLARRDELGKEGGGNSE